MGTAICSSWICRAQATVWSSRRGGGLRLLQDDQLFRQMDIVGDPALPASSALPRRQNGAQIQRPFLNIAPDESPSVIAGNPRQINLRGRAAVMPHDGQANALNVGESMTAASLAQVPLYIEG